VLLDVGFEGAEYVVPDTSAQQNGHTEPHVEGHEDEHQQEGYEDLQDVQEGLQQVHPGAEDLELGATSSGRGVLLDMMMGW